jgi:hypothetical protein
MKTTAIRALAAALLVLSTSGLASANFTFNLSNVNLTLGVGGPPDGTLTGTFTTDNSLTTLVSYDIVASASGNFAGFTYLTGDAVTNSLPSFFQIDSGSNELRLIFNGGLTTSGATLSTSSFEDESASGGLRNVATGSVVVASAVPEPASIVLTGSALTVVLGAAGARRRLKARWVAEVSLE